MVVRRNIHGSRFLQVSYWLAVIAWLAVFIVSIIRMVAVRREQSGETLAGRDNRPDLFRGVTLISDKLKKRPPETITPTKVIPAERTPMAQFETKIKPLETAA